MIWSTFFFEFNEEKNIVCKLCTMEFRDIFKLIKHHEASRIIISLLFQLYVIKFIIFNYSLLIKHIIDVFNKSTSQIKNSLRYINL